MKRRMSALSGLILFIVLDTMLLLSGCDQAPSHVQADDVRASTGAGRTTVADGAGRSAPPTLYGASAPMAPGSDGLSPMLASAPPGAGPVNTGNAAASGPQATTTATEPAPPPIMLNATEAQFFAQAGEVLIFEARAAEIAATRADDSAVKSYAAMLISDQSAMTGGLQQLASRLHVPLPVSLSLARQQTLDGLVQATPESFDRQFVQIAGSRAQQSMIALFEQAMREAQNPAIVDYANGALAILRAHLSTAQKLPIQG
ncbi:MAG: DUF4142 domain-containing protein [Aquabacterium sp.]|uniref:DUF4142 domain-containing protein n=1 Tax=Aquabacterium sp. TaxID=1872578 RepID=UPI0025C13E4D|nr:DUF4142 domain-containing protein [Aquabacterium sp.]MBI3382020.1 DUF4142 domain-containing protein [Aquabacterium sp.]